MRLSFDLEGIDWTFHVSAESVSYTPPVGLVDGGVLQEYKERVSRCVTTGADDGSRNDSGGDGGGWFLGTGGGPIQLGMVLLERESINRLGRVSERGTRRKMTPIDDGWACTDMYE